MPGNQIKPFRFWCQKVLPLVFDDSLSYYEVLCKVANSLNSLIGDMNTAISDIEGLQRADTALRDYVDSRFNNLDFNEAAQNALDELVTNGTMDSIVTPIIAEYANPVFVDSVNDMTAKNIAYANKENNLVYRWNTATSGYVSTGHQFGGIVDNVNDMTDTTKYYALSDNALLYEYAYSSGEWISDNTVFGGYKNGVAAMVPIGKTYVLKTNMHIYQWNGDEYVDSGIQYGVPDGVLLWRRKLTASDNLLGLSENGWYTFDANSIPQNAPQNMKADSGFVIVYGNNNPERTLADNISENITNEENNELRANSGIRVTLKTANGGSWLWTGYDWINQSNVGFLKCNDCDNVNYNSSLYCDSNTDNKPNTTNGVLLTLWVESVKEQIFIGNNTLWFRTENNEWTKVSSDERVDELEGAIQAAVTKMDTLFLIANSRITNLENEITPQLTLLTNANAQLNDKVNNAIYSLGEYADVELLGENNNEICAENGDIIASGLLVVKTDTTLTQSHMAADSKSVGDALAESNLRIDETQELVNTVQRTVYAISNTVGNNSSEIARLNYSANALKSTASQALNGLKSIASVSAISLLCENYDEISTENNEAIKSELYAAKTDETLTDEELPANAKTTGDKIAQLQHNVNENSDNLTETRIILNGVYRIVDSVTTMVSSPVLTQNALEITTQNGNTIERELRGIKTDTSLSDKTLPANAKTTGNAITSINLNCYKNNEKNADANNQLNARIQKLETTIQTLSALTSKSQSQLTTNNSDSLLTQSGVTLMCEQITITTDTTLSNENLPANAQSVGLAIENDSQTTSVTNVVVSNDTTMCFILAQNFECLVCENGSPIKSNIAISIKPPVLKLTNANVVFYGPSGTWGVGGTGFNGFGETISGEIVYSGIYGTYYRNTAGYCWANALKKQWEKWLGCHVINNGMGALSFHRASKLDVLRQAVSANTDVLFVNLGSTNDVNQQNVYPPTFDNILAAMASIQGYCYSNHITPVYIQNSPKETEDTSEYNRFAMISNAISACAELNFKWINPNSWFTNYYLTKGLPVGTYSDHVHLNDDGYRVLANAMNFAVGSLMPEVKGYDETWQV